MLQIECRSCKNKKIIIIDSFIFSGDISFFMEKLEIIRPFTWNEYDTWISVFGTYKSHEKGRGEYIIWGKGWEGGGDKAYCHSPIQPVGHQEDGGNQVPR